MTAPRPETAAVNAELSSRLRELQNQLLDLSRRNRLLNFRGDKGAASLRVIDEVPSEVYRTLVANRRAMRFLSREEAPKEIAASLNGSDDGSDGSDVGVSLPPLDGGTLAERHRDNWLQTALEGEKLQTRLTRLAHQAGSAIEEQGANILYIALGIVAWRETAGSDVVSNAPLLLIPVELSRTSVNSRHQVRMSDEDVVLNPCLLELSSRQFDVAIPAPDFSVTDETFELAAYFQQVATAVKPLGWSLDGEQIHLGLFSFSKLLMYRDLDPAVWPVGASIADHPLVARLLGVDSRDPVPHVQPPRPEDLDDALRPIDQHQVMDADSSQQVAIVAARDGASAVIEGPPGTGKSQTITNIIAECLAQGRTVLFVAEKAAALEVVERRLGAVGLGEFLLKLHSRQSSKATMLADLQRCLAQAADERSVPDVDPEELARTRARLNAYARELHAARPPLSLSAYNVISRLTSRLEPRPDFAIPDIHAWSRPMLADAREKMTTLDARLRRVGDPASHPWRAVALTRLGSEAKQLVKSLLSQIRKALDDLQASGRELTGWLAGAAPDSLRAIEATLERARLLSETPAGVEAVSWRDPRWTTDEIDALLADGARYTTLRNQWQSTFAVDADHSDWRDVLERRRRGPGLVRWLGSDWRADTKRLRDVCLGKLPSRTHLLEPLAALAEGAALRTSIEERGRAYRDLLCDWQAEKTDWVVLDRTVVAARRVQRLARDAHLDSSAVDRCLAERTALAVTVGRAEQAARALRAIWRSWVEATGSTDVAWTGAPVLIDASLKDLAASLERADRAWPDLDDWIGYQAISTQLNAGPLKAAADWAVSPAGRTAGGTLAALFEQRWYELWLEHVVDECPTLAEFHGDEHADVVDRFGDLDRHWIDATRSRVATALRARRPQTTGSANRGSKLGRLELEMRKKKGHMPVRRLLLETGEVIQAVKPCFMMSPISVAQYLAPGGPTFDIVIFDEASQVEPADAFGAIARGRQILLVGDEKQLPPTAFFKKVEVDAPGQELDADAGDSSKDLESILGLGWARLPHRFTLRWHYRSRHDSLITFSNARFYDNLLRVFPSAHTSRDELGLQLRFVGGRYLRGAGQTNPDEVRAVVDAIVAHAHAHENLTLGVGTFNMSQQLAILDELERHRRQQRDDRLEAFLAKEGAEPFFVKNLETIQGDERDVIFLSVTYGRDEAGRLLRNFGPLNRDGGWRRLNVLVTRARQRCIVFSSIRADDITLPESAPRGVVALKEYLDFAEHGALSTTPVADGGFDSGFEEDVANVLRQRGFEVHSQVGAAGFSIDLAIVDSERRGRYLVGIECDGATYHASPTARDRDRLRQEVLEGLGWCILRIWSTDWFKNRERAIERLIAGIQTARQGKSRPPKRVAYRSPATIRTVSQVSEESPAYGLAAPDKSRPVLGELARYARRPIRVAGDDINDTSAVIPALIDLVNVEGPIHVDEAGRILCHALRSRLTESNAAALELAIAAAIEAQAVERKGAFLQPPGATPVVRFRGGDCPVTKPDLIPPQEYDEAVRLVLRREFGLQPDVLDSAVARTMGFERLGERLKDEISRAVARVLASGDARIDGRGYVVPFT